MFRNILVVSLFLFSTSAWSDEDPLPEVTMEPPETVKHSIERLWLSDDAVSCLIQLNASNSPQQSCLSFWKVIEGRRLLFISTRVPFVTNGNTSLIMFTTLSRSSLKEEGDTGGYTLFTGPYRALSWSLSGI